MRAPPLRPVPILAVARRALANLDFLFAAILLLWRGAAGETASVSPAPAAPRMEVPFDSNELIRSARLRAAALQAKLGPHRITLLDAVRVTLAHDPAVRLAEEDARAARGAVRISSGAFDTRLTGEAAYTHARDRLPAAQIRKQQVSEEQARQVLQQIESNLAAVTGPVSPASIVAAQLQAVEAQVLLSFATPQQLAQFQALSAQQAALSIQEAAATRESLAEQRRGAEKVLHDAGNIISVQTTDSISSNATVQRTFRNGLSFGPFLQYNQGSNALSLAAGQSPLAQSEVGFFLAIPLGKGLGKKSAAAPERSAQAELEASLYNLRHTKASSVLNTVLAYWDCVGAQERLALQVRSELTTEVLMRLTQALIQADELAPAELSLVQARASSASAARLAAELDLLQARQRLAMAMGLPAAEMKSAPLPAEPFPMVLPPAAYSADALVEEALRRRQDRQALLALERSRKILLDAAAVNLRPRVDLNLRTGYTGLSEGSGTGRALETFTDRQSGPGFSATLSFDWPLASTAERGQLQQAQAFYRQQQVRTADLDRTIASNVIFACGSLENSRERIQRTQAAAGSLQAALETARERFRLGNSTLLDSITIEQQLTGALSDVVTAQVLHAQSIVSVRFQSGTLLPSGDGAAVRLGRERLVDLPSLAEAPPPPLAIDRAAEHAQHRLFRTRPALRSTADALLPPE